MTQELSLKIIDTIVHKLKQGNQLGDLIKHEPVATFVSHLKDVQPGTDLNGITFTFNGYNEPVTPDEVITALVGGGWVVKNDSNQKTYRFRYLEHEKWPDVQVVIYEQGKRDSS
jgi:hypothetical protein